MSDFNTSVDETLGTIDGTHASSAKSKIAYVKRKLINVDFDRNPRLRVKYTKAKLEWLARNIHDNGLLDPIVVSKRADGTYWLLKGHLRYSAIMINVDEGLDAVPKTKDSEGKPAVAADPNFMADIKCHVIEGLSPEDEIDLVMDHGTVTKLDRKEEYKAVSIMMMAGFTQQYMADKMKRSRPSISKLVWVRQMPSCVEDAFLSEDKEALTLNDETIVELYKAYTEDKKNGSRPKTEGPLFSTQWAKFVSEGKAKRVKSMTQDDLIKTAELYNDVDIQDILLAISKSDKPALSSAIQRVQLRMVPVGCVPPDRLLNDLETHLISEGIDKTVHDAELVEIN